MARLALVRTGGYNVDDSIGLTGYPQVDMLGVRYKPVHFGAGKSPWRSGFRILGYGFRVSDFGVRVDSFRFRVSGFGFRVLSGWLWLSGFRVSGFGWMFSSFGFRVSGFGFRVSGFGFREDSGGPTLAHFYRLNRLFSS